MLDLSNVTLVTIDSVADHLSKNNIRLAVMSRVFPKIIEGINFGDILMINPFNKNAHIIDEKFDTLWDYDFDTNKRNINWYSNFVVKKLPYLIKTEWYLIIQWDGFPLLHYDTWKNEFFNYPYLGGGHTLWNGGFSLRNTDVMKKLSKYNESFGAGSEDNFYSMFFDTSKYKKQTITPINLPWDDDKISKEFCYFFNGDDTKTFGWHRNGFLSNFNLKQFFRRYKCFDEMEINKIIQYCNTKDIDNNILIENYMEYFDLSYNEDFYNY